MKKQVLLPGLLSLSLVAACAPTDVVSTAQVYNPVDSVQEYTQRSDKVTLSAGNAAEVNERVQEVDPWPRNVGNKQIAVNGERMANAVFRYRCNKPAPPTLVPEQTAGASANVTGAVAASTLYSAPGSDCTAGPQVQVQGNSQR
jgi:hypothetical protein